MEQLKNHIVLMGIKHCGKSTLGKSLAKYFNCSFFDTDNLIKEVTKKTPRQIYESEGAQGFAAAELKACNFLAEKLQKIDEFSTDTAAVIATGGGICNNKDAVEILKSLGNADSCSILVFLEVQEKIAVKRIVAEAAFEKDKISNLPAYIAKKNPHTLEDVRNIFHDFYVERTALYKNICDISVPVGAFSVKENTQLIVQKILSR